MKKLLILLVLLLTFTSCEKDDLNCDCLRITEIGEIRTEGDPYFIGYRPVYMDNKCGLTPKFYYHSDDLIDVTVGMCSEDSPLSDSIYRQ